jgi:hypothetical protein
MFPSAIWLQQHYSSTIILLSSSRPMCSITRVQRKIRGEDSKSADMKDIAKRDSFLAE